MERMSAYAQEVKKTIFYWMNSGIKFSLEDEQVRSFTLEPKFPPLLDSQSSSDWNKF